MGYTPSGIISCLETARTRADKVIALDTVMSSLHYMFLEGLELDNWIFRDVFQVLERLAE